MLCYGIYSNQGGLELPVALNYPNTRLPLYKGETGGCVFNIFQHASKPLKEIDIHHVGGRPLCLPEFVRAATGGRSYEK